MIVFIQIGTTLHFDLYCITGIIKKKMKKIVVFAIVSLLFYTAYCIYFEKEIFYIDSAKEILGLDNKTNIESRNISEPNFKNNSDFYEPWMILVPVVFILFVGLISITGGNDNSYFPNPYDRWDRIPSNSKSEDFSSSADIIYNDHN